MSTVLITGTNRGIGLELTKAYLAKGYQVIAAVRDVSKMPKIDGKVVVIKLDSGTTDGAAEAVKELKSKGIDQLDLVSAIFHTPSFAPKMYCVQLAISLDDLIIIVR